MLRKLSFIAFCTEDMLNRLVLLFEELKGPVQVYKMASDAAHVGRVDQSGEEHGAKLYDKFQAQSAWQRRGKERGRPTLAAAANRNCVGRLRYRRR